MRHSQRPRRYLCSSSFDRPALDPPASEAMLHPRQLIIFTCCLANSTLSLYLAVDTAPGLPDRVSGVRRAPRRLGMMRWRAPSFVSCSIGFGSSPSIVVAYSRPVDIRLRRPSITAVRLVCNVIHLDLGRRCSSKPGQCSSHTCRLARYFGEVNDRSRAVILRLATPLHI